MSKANVAAAAGIDITMKSVVGKLFKPDFSKDKDLTEALASHVGCAEELLDAAIAVSMLGKGHSIDRRSCSYCSNVLEILEALKDALRVGRHGVELEQMRRKKGKAA